MTENAIKPEPKVTEKVPVILLEILVYGLEKDKTRIRSMLNELQKQLDKSRSNKHKARVFFYMDNGEMTDEQKQKHLIENSNCRYYVFAPQSYIVPSTFVSDSLLKIKKLDTIMLSVKSSGIKPKTKTKPKDPIEYAQIIE